MAVSASFNGAISASRRLVPCANFEADRGLAPRPATCRPIGIGAVIRSSQPEPLQSGDGEDRRLGDALLQLAQPRLDVAAKIDDAEVRPNVEHLRFAPQR